MVYRESVSVTGNFDWVFFTEVKNATRISHFDKYVGIVRTYYDEHNSTYHVFGWSSDSLCFIYIRVAAVLFQRYNVSAFVCWRRGAYLPSLADRGFLSFRNKQTRNLLEGSNKVGRSVITGQDICFYFI